MTRTDRRLALHAWLRRSITSIAGPEVVLDRLYRLFLSGLTDFNLRRPSSVRWLYVWQMSRRPGSCEPVPHFTVAATPLLPSPLPLTAQAVQTPVGCCGSERSPGSGVVRYSLTSRFLDFFSLSVHGLTPTTRSLSHRRSMYRAGGCKAHESLCQILAQRRGIPALSLHQPEQFTHTWTSLSHADVRTTTCSPRPTRHV